MDAGVPVWTQHCPIHVRKHSPEFRLPDSSTCQLVPATLAASVLSCHCTKSPLVMGTRSIQPFQEDIGATPLPGPHRSQGVTATLLPSAASGPFPAESSKGFPQSGALVLPRALLRVPREPVVTLLPFWRGPQYSAPTRHWGRFTGLAKAALTPVQGVLRQSLPKPVSEI